jgi:hypothetical protein
MNYKIIGADQKEYGPVTTEQLKEWVKQGRANANTVAQVEGSPDWKPLSTFPEFIALFAPSMPTPPFTDKIDPEQAAMEILARDYDIDIGSCVSRAWELAKSDFWPIVGVSTLIMLILGAASAAYIGIIVGGPLMGGLLRYYLKKMRGEPAELADAFSGFQIAFLHLFLGGLISQLLEMAGFVCCILPGIYLMVAWQFTLPLIIDKRLDFWPAMELSRKVVSKQWWTFFGFMIVTVLINLLGVLCCVVGVFVSLPVTLIALMFAYEDIFRDPRKAPAQPL